MAIARYRLAHVAQHQAGCAIIRLFRPKSLAQNPIRQRPMTYFHLKLIAAICMVIDHVGHVFYPGDTLFRIIGRLSFPLFAWLLTQGEHKTHNIRAYFRRLAIFAVISQPFYSWLFEESQLNVLVTLGVGLAALRIGKEFPAQKYLIWMAGLVVAGLIPMDGGAYGLGVILLMSTWQPLEWRSPESVESVWATGRWWALWIGLHLFYSYSTGILIQRWAMFAPLFLYALNYRRGPKARWFYGFYPGHLAALLLIKLNGL